MQSNEFKDAQLAAKGLDSKDVEAKRSAIARIVELCDLAKAVEDKLQIVPLLFPALDEACGQICRIVSTLAIPPVNSPEESRLQQSLRKLMPRLWESSAQFSAQACEITRLCIKSFQSRLLGADTFEFGDFVHTSLWLGKGTEGVVHLGFQISQNGRRVAIKTIERALIDQHSWEGPLDKGFAFLQKANHPGIVKLFHVQKLDTCWYVYMEHIDGGDLRSFLCKQDPSKKEPSVRVVLSEPKAKEIFRKLIEPVGYLRRNNVIHRDLKPANFMLTRSGEVKLVDFATMRDSVESGGLAESVKGTPAYMAPEIWFSSKIKYDGEKVDVWSIGVILYEMVCGALPWEGSDVRTLLRNVNTTPLRIAPSLGLSKELCDLLVHTLKVDPRFRMTWHELEGHEWLAEDPMAGVGNFMEEAVNQLQLTVEKLQLKCRTLEQAAESKDNVIRELSRELQQLRSEKKGKAQAELEAQFQKTLAEREEQWRKAEQLREAQKKEALEAQFQSTLAEREREWRQAEQDREAKWQNEEQAKWQRALAEREEQWQKGLCDREARWRKEFDEQNAAISKLRADSEALSSQLAQATSAASEKHAALTADVQAGLKREEDLKEKVLLATKQVVALRDAANNSQRLQEEVVQLRQSQAALFNMQQRVAGAEQEIARLRADKVEVESERDHLKAMVEDVLGNLTRSADGQQDVRERIRHLEEDLEDSRRLLRERDAEVESLRADISTLKFLVEESNNMH